MRPPLIFLSYRRADTGPLALALRAELELRLDGIPVFLDLSRLAAGDRWQNIVEDALRKANIVIALIGPQWTGLRDDGSHRIGEDDDWVRKEVAFGLADPRKSVVGILTNDAPIPDGASLPADVRPLLDRQMIRLRVESWGADVKAICEALDTQYGVRRKDQDAFLPKPKKLIELEEPLSDENLERSKAAGMLDGWDVEIIHDAMRSGFVKEYLRKRFVFKKDQAAFDFVRKIAEITAELEHHPVVDLVWKTITIRLTTFDAGHRITTLDRRMAIAIDKAFAVSRQSPHQPQE